MTKTPRILTIAGSDCSGGAGIQGDMRAVNALGGYASSVITAVTAQNTHGVSGVHGVPAEFVAQQVGAVLEDIGADAIKTGMLYSADIIESIANAISQAKLRGNIAQDTPMIVDTVMRSGSGNADLMRQSGEALSALKKKLIPMAALVTPNIPEAQILADMGIESRDDMVSAAQKIQQMGAKSVLIKGGHASGDELHDLLLCADGRQHWFSALRQKNAHTHGTGCAYASAIATIWGGAGSGDDISSDKLRDIIAQAHAYVQSAITNSAGIGGGNCAVGVGDRLPQ